MNLWDTLGTVGAQDTRKTYLEVLFTLRGEWDVSGTYLHTEGRVGYIGLGGTYFEVLFALRGEWGTAVPVVIVDPHSPMVVNVV